MIVDPCITPEIDRVELSDADVLLVCLADLVIAGPETGRSVREPGYPKDVIVPFRDVLEVR